MNKAYRSVWNESTQTWVAAQENAAARGKTKSAVKGASVLAAMALAGGITSEAEAATCYGSGVYYGYSACAIDGPDTAVGYNAYAADPSGPGINPQDFATAFGNFATANGDGTVALGGGAQAGSAALAAQYNYATAVGPIAQALAFQTTALGYSAIADQNNATAIGAQSQARAVSALALGSQSTVSAAASQGIAIGATSTVAAANALALGTGAIVATGATNSSAIGTTATVTANTTNAIAIGTGSVANVSNTVSVGAVGAERKIVNVANGTLSATSTDAVNGSQLYSLQSQITNISGATNAVVYDTSAHTSVTLGGSGTTKGIALRNVSNGSLSATSLDAVNGSQLYAVNTQVTANTTSISTLNGQVTTLQGNVTTINGQITTLQGNVTTINGQVTTLQGNVTTLNTQVTTLQGQMANAVMYDTSAHDSLTLGGSGSTKVVALHNVANGALSSTSTDAVNGSQLYATNSNVTNVTNTVNNITNGGGIKYFHTTSTLADSSAAGTNSTAIGPAAIHNLADGTVDSDAVNLGQMNAAIANVTNIANNATDPMFAASGDRNTEAASASGQHATASGANASASGDQSVAVGANSAASGTNATAIGANSTATGAGSVALGQGSVATDANTVSVGSDTLHRRVTNVAAGVNGTDAVNVDQLNDAVNNVQSNTAQQVQQGVQAANQYTNQQIGVVKKQMNVLGATTMAASSLIPNARAEGNFQMSVAAGTYGGESALALGANWYVSDRVLVNAHVARSTSSYGSTGVSVGATIGF